MPAVSICLTTYNRASSLNKTIDSILAQTFSDFELIICDDNSTDNTALVCEYYEHKDSRVKYFRNANNLKMPGNLNRAISLTSGDFIANLHDGDIYRIDLIEKWYQLLCEYPNALFVFNEYLFIDEQKKLTYFIKHDFSDFNDGSKLLDYFFCNLTSAPWGTVMVRKSAYVENGVFNGEYGFISDVEMWLRLAMKGPFCYVTEPLITLTPREKNHTYFLPHWSVTYNNMRILSVYYNLVYDTSLKLVLNKGHILRKMRRTVVYELLLLLKYGEFRRVFMHLNLVLPFFGIKLFSFISVHQSGCFENWVRVTRLEYRSNELIDNVVQMK